MVYAIQGRGTFVASEPLAEPPNGLLSFHDMAAGDNVVGRLAGRSRRRAPGDDQRGRGLRDRPRAPALLTLERLRTLDGLPVALDFTLVPVALEPDLPGLDWQVASLYSTLAAAGHSPVAADYSVEAQTRRRAVAARLLATRRRAPARGRVAGLRQADRLIVLRPDLLPRRPLPLPQPADRGPAASGSSGCARAV